MNDFIVNVQVAVVRNGKYLFIIRSESDSYMPGAKALPGGKAEQGDNDDRSLETTGIREVEEETGVMLAPDLRYVRSNTFADRVMNVLLIGRWESGEPYPHDADEVADCVWLTAAQVYADDDIAKWEKEHVRQAEAVRAQLGW